MHLLLPVFIFISLIAAIIGSVYLRVTPFNSDPESSSGTEVVVEDLAINIEESQAARPSQSSPKPTQFATNKPKATNGEASVSLQSNVKKPNGYDFVINFNPEAIEVTEVRAGSMWSNTNVLNSSINQTSGIVKIAAGQGFGAEVTNSSVLLTIKYRLKADVTATLFTVDPNSKFGYAGQSSLTSVNPSDVTIAISE